VSDDVKSFVEAKVSETRVVLFLKGTKEKPACSFSADVVEILDSLGVPYKCVNVLQSNELRQELKSYSDWPTFPQLYIDGVFIGGRDIVKEMYEANELHDHLSELGLRAV